MNPIPQAGKKVKVQEIGLNLEKKKLEMGIVEMTNFFFFFFPGILGKTWREGRCIRFSAKMIQRVL